MTIKYFWTLLLRPVPICFCHLNSSKPPPVFDLQNQNLDNQARRTTVALQCTATYQPGLPPEYSIIFLYFPLLTSVIALVKMCLDKSWYPLVEEELTEIVSPCVNLQLILLDEGDDWTLLLSVEGEEDKGKVSELKGRRNHILFLLGHCSSITMGSKQFQVCINKQCNCRVQLFPLPSPAHLFLSLRENPTGYFKTTLHCCMWCYVLILKKAKLKKCVLLLEQKAVGKWAGLSASWVQ